MKNLIKNKIFITSILFFITIQTSLFSQTTVNNTEKFNLWGSKDVFVLSPLTDSLILGSGLAFFTTDILLEKVFNVNYVDVNQYQFDFSNIPNLDQLLMHEYSKPLDYISTESLGLTLLSPGIFCILPPEEYFTIATMYAESLLWTESIKSLGKLLVTRARPYMFYENYPEKKVQENDWDDSWPSGHTAFAFNAATFTSYVFCQYFPDSNFKLPVIATTYALAMGTGILRIASGNHFYSDVVCGALLGTLTGFTIPLFHKVNSGLKKSNMNVALAPGAIDFRILF